MKDSTASGFMAWGLSILLGMGITGIISVHAAELDSPSETTWQAPMGVDHPLTGRIWDVGTSEFISEQGLLDRLSSVRFVLAGESHNNPDHHQLQLRILEAMVTSGRRVSLGMELFTSADQPALNRYMKAQSSDPDALLNDLGWGRKRSALWGLYAPLVRFAGETGLPLVAMDMSRSEVSAVKLQGLSAIPNELITRFALDQPLPGKLQQILVRDLLDAHCGLMLPQDLEGPLLAQRARDAIMAQRLEGADAGDGVLLLSGYGHARNDRGVPYLLREPWQDGSLVSVLFASVKEDLVQPQDYAAWFDGERLPFEYVWFTPRVDDEDPCERLERIYGKPKKSS